MKKIAVNGNIFHQVEEYNRPGEEGVGAGCYIRNALKTLSHFQKNSYLHELLAFSLFCLIIIFYFYLFGLRLDFQSFSE